MRMKKIVLILSVLFSNSLLAGHADGNGGASLVCRDNGGSIISANLIDLYFGKKEVGALEDYRHFKYSNKMNDYYLRGCGKGLEIEQSSLSISEQIEGAINKLTIPEKGKKSVLQFINEIRATYKLTDSFMQLPRDTGIPRSCMDWIEDTPNCKMEYTALYNKEGLELKRDVFKFWVDNGNKTEMAALFVHEGLHALKKHYSSLKFGRKSGYCSDKALAELVPSGLASLLWFLGCKHTNTLLIQDVVAKLFSDESVVKIPELRPVLPLLKLDQAHSYHMPGDTFINYTYVTYSDSEEGFNFYLDTQILEGSSNSCKDINYFAGFKRSFFRKVLIAEPQRIGSEPLALNWKDNGMRRKWINAAKSYRSQPYISDFYGEDNIEGDWFSIEISNDVLCRMSYEDKCHIELSLKDDQGREFWNSRSSIQIDLDSPEQFRHCQNGESKESKRRVYDSFFNYGPNPLYFLDSY